MTESCPAPLPAQPGAAPSAMASVAVSRSGNRERSGAGVERRWVRSWPGFDAEVVEWRNRAQSLEKLHGRALRLIVVLEQIGGSVDLREQTDRPPPRGPAESNRLCLVPPNMPVWHYGEGVRYLRRLSLSFDVPTLTAGLPADSFSVEPLKRFLRLSDPVIWKYAELVAAECQTPGPLSGHYGQSLGATLFLSLLRAGRAMVAEAKCSGLAPWQLRLATDYMEAHPAERLRLGALAAITGLSEAHFGRAFKAATGLPPCRWHMNLRIGRAQKLLTEGNMTIAEVALAVGFADQSHFTHAFRDVAGMTPGRWQRTRRA